MARLADKNLFACYVFLTPGKYGSFATTADWCFCSHVKQSLTPRALTSSQCSPALLLSHSFGPQKKSQKTPPCGSVPNCEKPETTFFEKKKQQKKQDCFKKMDVP